MACDTHVVIIGQDRKPNPPDTVTLHKGLGHRILWTSEADQAYDICFDEERFPFENGPTFRLDPHRWVNSGPIKDDAEEGKANQYHYGIKVATKAGTKARTKEVAADPDVIIER
jgi:hypothetical protein